LRGEEAEAEQKAKETVEFMVKVSGPIAEWQRNQHY
jgi:hypothetical protein